MVPVVRQHSAAFMNSVVNHEEVRPWLGGDPSQPIDLTAHIADPRNYAFAGEHGGIFFQHIVPGVYEAHTQVLPAGRGAWTLEMVLSCLHEMFCGSDAIEILTRVPEGNIGARALVRALGRIVRVTSLMKRDAWMEAGRARPCEFFSMTIQDWMRCAPELVEAGRLLDDALDAEFRRLKRRRKTPMRDEERDRYAGVAYEMMRRGLPMKAALFYNRWASLASYAPIQIETVEPLVVDIGDCRILASQDHIEVLPYH